jgi:hypothetical protein
VLTNLGFVFGILAGFKGLYDFARKWNARENAREKQQS